MLTVAKLIPFSIALSEATQNVAVTPLSEVIVGVVLMMSKRGILLLALTAVLGWFAWAFYLSPTVHFEVDGVGYDVPRENVLAGGTRFTPTFGSDGAMFFVLGKMGRQINFHFWLNDSETSCRRERVSLQRTEHPCRQVAAGAAYNGAVRRFVGNCIVRRERADTQLSWTLHLADRCKRSADEDVTLFCQTGTDANAEVRGTCKFYGVYRGSILSVSLYDDETQLLDAIYRQAINHLDTWRKP